MHLLHALIQSVVRGGPTLTVFLVDERGFKYYNKEATIGPLAKSNSNGVSLVAGQ